MNIYFDDSFKNMLFKGQTEAIRNIEKVFCEKLKYFFKYSENIGIKFYVRNETVSQLDLDSENLKITFGLYDNNHFITSGVENDLKKLGIGAESFSMIAPDYKDTECVFEKNDIPIAIFDKARNIIYFTFLTSFTRIERTKKVLNLILETLDFFSKQYPGVFCFKESEQNNNENQIQEKNKKIFGETLKSFYNKKKTELISDIDYYKRELQSYTKNLKAYNKKIKLLNEDLEAIENKTLNDILLDNVYVDEVKNDGSIVHILTKDLFITHFDKQRYNELIDKKHWVSSDLKYDNRKKMESDKEYKFYLGKFDIEINLNNMNVKFFNLNNKRRSYWGKNCNAPHVDEDGKACLGDLSELMGYAISNNDLYLLIDLCIQYLQSVNLSDLAGKYVISWDLYIEDGDSLINYETGEKFEQTQISYKNIEELLF